jgi:bifunctional non-homologous end joining protein LigD
MAKRSSIWEDKGSRYGTYEGPRGNPTDWASAFGGVWENSPTVKTLEALENYRTLNLSPTATDAEVKKRFRTLVKQHHPDHGGDSEIYQRVVEAYQRIINPTQSTVINAPNFSPTHSTRPTSQSTQSPTDAEPLIVPQLLTEIDETELDRYLNSAAFGAQEKKDGKHLTLQITRNSNLFIRNKKGAISTCAPEFEAALRQVGFPLLVDGEQVNGIFWVWDLLELDGQNLRPNSYHVRYAKLKELEALFGSTIRVLKLVTTRADKIALFNELKARGKEGIVFKKLSAPFSEGKGEDQVKFKFYAEASVIVVAGRPGKQSIGMELFDANGNREFVGYCSCALHPLPPIDSIAEVKYLYAYHGGCLYQTAFKELRDDIDLSECKTAQLKYKAES